MRILMVSEDVPFPSMGGLAKHALNLSRALVRAGHQVDFLGNDQHPIDSAGDEGVFGGRFFGELKDTAGWKETTLGAFIPQRRSWLAKRFAKTILRYAPRYDVIHYHGHAPNVGYYIPEGINFIQTRHDQGSDCFLHIRFRNGKICQATAPSECAMCISQQPNAFQRTVSRIAVDRYRKEVAESFTRHKTVFVSNLLQSNCARTLGPHSWGTTVHNFVDLDRIKRARESALQTQYDKNGTINVFIAGKLYAPKGIEPFLEAFSSFAPANIQVTLAGEGEDEARLRKQFEGEQIHFLGWCSPERTLQMAAASDAVVVPSVCEESCATTVLEGIFLGKPTFALALGGTPELEIYASPGQLRLHPDMQSLVRDLVSLPPGISYTPKQDGSGGADHAAQQLLRLYQQLSTYHE